VEKMKMFFLAILASGYFSYVFGEMTFTVILCNYYQKKSVQREHTCSIRASPLCASNNVTYPNSCVFCFANIALNLTLTVQYNGICRKSAS
uniref:Kazal-like domain-containing protein n=2 Tax=Marmotini TaxID=337730 RepID=A0A8C9QCT0_SPEDA